MQKIIAEFRNVKKTFDSKRVINDISLKFIKGEFTALLGPSGCGKSTILRILAGFEEINDGSVLINDLMVTTAQHPPEKRDIGMVFQDLALFPHLTVAGNIEFGLRGKKSEKKEQVAELLKLVGMDGMGNTMPHMLSGGQQQRVAVARALAPRPKLLLMDEPFSSLDYQLRLQMREELWNILKKEAVSVVLVTHDCQEAFGFADKVVLINYGRVIQEGTPAKIYHQPQTPWAAEFVGGANFITARADQRSILSELGCFQNQMGRQFGSYYQMIRPENLSVYRSEPERCSGYIQNISFLGDREVLTIRLKSGNSLMAYVESGQNWSLSEPVSVHPKQFLLFPSQEKLN
ncbi:MAG: ABC transporter ATP-binding protein [Desulfobacterales bacterium]|nr:ABC transporter ATP-binding protein [Desulfobacterales bacterium]